MTRALLVRGAAVLLLGLGGACAGSPAPDAPAAAEAPRPLTSAEATRLARIRPMAHEAGARTFEGTVVDADGTVFLEGWIDTHDHVGFAVARPRGATAGGSFLTLWGPSEVSAQAAPPDGLPAAVPADGWQTAALDPATSVLAAAQVLLVSLSGEQPENPLLLETGGARWLGTDEVGGVAVDVLAGVGQEDGGPSRLHYFVDGEGHLLRLEAQLDGERWSTFDFADAPGLDTTLPTPG